MAGGCPATALPRSWCVPQLQLCPVLNITTTLCTALGEKECSTALQVLLSCPFTPALLHFVSTLACTTTYFEGMMSWDNKQTAGHLSLIWNACLTFMQMSAVYCLASSSVHWQDSVSSNVMQRQWVAKFSDLHSSILFVHQMQSKC